MRMSIRIVMVFNNTHSTTPEYANSALEKAIGIKSFIRSGHPARMLEPRLQGRIPPPLLIFESGFLTGWLNWVEAV